MSEPLITNQTALELSALQQMAEMLASSIGLEEVLGRCMGLQLEVAHAPEGVLYLLDERRKQFRRVAQRNVSDEIAPATLPVDALRNVTNGPVDLEKHAIAGNPRVLAAKKHGLKMVYILRLQRHGKLIGFFGIHFFESIELPRSTMQTLEAIADYEAIAIECAQARRQLELRVQLASDLRTFGDQANLIESEPELHALILKTALKISRSDGAFLSQEHSDHLQVAAIAGLGVPLLGEKLPLGDGVSLEDSATPIAIEDTSKLGDKLLGGPLERIARSNDASSLLALRLPGKGRWRGQLIARSSIPHEYELEEIEAFRILGEMVAQHLDRTSAHRDIVRQNRELDQVIEHLPIAIQIFSFDGEVLHSNAAARRVTESLHGLAPDVVWDERSARIRYSRVDGSPLPHEELPITRAFRGEYPEPMEMILSNAAGTFSATVLGMASPLPRLPDDPLHGIEPQRVVCALQDVTKLRELANSKELFLTIAAHELRSPITSLWATSSLIELDPAQLDDPIRRAKLTERVLRQVGRLKRLVEELLESARLGRSQLPLQLEKVDLSKLCAETVDRCRETAGKTKIELAGADAPIHGRYDVDRIEQVLTNLLANAIRYSPEGSTIHLRIGRHDETVRIEIEDQGIGVPADQQSRLFIPFFRAHNALASNKAGLGLGLYISSQIVGRHGGTMNVRSKEGIGSIFAFELPLLPPEDTQHDDARG